MPIDHSLKRYPIGTIEITRNDGSNHTIPENQFPASVTSDDLRLDNSNLKDIFIPDMLNQLYRILTGISGVSPEGPIVRAPYQQTKTVQVTLPSSDTSAGYNRNLLKTA